MPGVKEAKHESEVIELAAADAPGAPGHLIERAAKVHLAECGEAILEEGSVKSGVMADNEADPFQGLIQRAVVDFLPAHHFVGDTGKLHHLGRYRLARILKAFVARNHAVERAAFAAVLARGDGDIDNPVAAVQAEACGFGIDHGKTADGFARAVFSEYVVLGELHAPKHPVIRIGFE